MWKLSCRAQGDADRRSVVHFQAPLPASLLMGKKDGGRNGHFSAYVSPGGSDVIPYCSPRYPFVRAILQPLSHVVARPFNPFAPSGKPADFHVSGLHQEILNSPVNGFESQTQDAVDVS